MNTARFKKLATQLGLTLPLVVFLFLADEPCATAEDITNRDDIGIEIATLIESKHNPLLAKPNFSEQQEPLAKLYELNNNHLLWLGKTDTDIESAIAILENAKAEGLEPADYDATTLKGGMKLATSLPQSASRELAKFDVALSIAVLRFLNDLHHGKVNPRQFDYPLPFGKKSEVDLASLVKQATEQHTIARLPQLLEPKLKQYQQLKQALADYRNSPKELDFEPLSFESSLRPGKQYPHLAELRQRLIALGALPDSAQSDAVPVYYDSELQEGVKAFQRNSGLQADGIIGKETAARLNQTREQKILQIELAMERLRWLPKNLSGPLIIVNIPAFQLWAFSSIDDSEILNMKVIVGKALANQTPVLLEDMKYVEFMPYWNIPKSIMDKEILPKLYDDFGYLESQDIELIQRHDDDTSSWDTLFDDIRRGRVRGRQRPGNKNPLGKVKFIFPNKEDVYLHDTSMPRLFDRSQRDFSHGCVRVAQAEKLAEFVFSQQPDSRWDSTSIQEAMAGSKTRRVNLRKPIPVLFYYTTTFVDHNGQIQFYRDIYHQDSLLEKALGKIPGSHSESLLTAKTTTPG
jgi:murein L,D-transpeptidase YcbB/YkuD